jgi:hypothetical protein
MYASHKLDLKALKRQSLKAHDIQNRKSMLGREAISRLKFHKC